MRMISIIVPVYNNARELPRCLDSLLAQDVANLEIIAVNDGSTDESAAILEAYARKHPNIRVISQENRGVTAARLAGLAAASAEVIGFADADDTVDADLYARLLRNMTEFDADISHCGFRMAFPDGRVHYFHNTGEKEIQSPKEALQALLSGQRIEPSLCTKLFRRELFAQLQSLMPEDIRVNEDLLMNFLLFSKANKVVYEDFCGYCYWVRADSAARQGLNLHRIADPIRVKQRILDIAPASVKNDAQRALLSTCIYVYNSILLAEGDFAENRRQVRQQILRQHRFFCLLTRRQRILAELIRFVPWLYKPLYRFYAAYLQKNPYV